MVSPRGASGGGTNRTTRPMDLMCASTATHSHACRARGPPEVPCPLRHAPDPKCAAILTWLACASAQRRPGTTAADESRVGEPSVAADALEYGGAAAAAPQPPAAGQQHQARLLWETLWPQLGQAGEGEEAPPQSPPPLQEEARAQTGSAQRSRSRRHRTSRRRCARPRRRP